MRRAVLGGVVAAALLTAGPAVAKTVTVTVGPGGSTTFSPANQTIQAGDTVHWVWSSSVHSTTSGSPPGTPDGTWDSNVQNKPFSYDVRFNTPGTFHYFCVVHYAEGMVGTITVGADEPPRATFSVTTPMPVVGQPVSFDGSASSDPDGAVSLYSWDFGDGSAMGSGARPVHAYALPGVYSVMMRVTDNSGKSAAVTQQLTVGSAGGDEPPTAAFSISPAAPMTAQSVTFDASGSSDPDGLITSYSWNFGDGSPPGSGPHPAHTYASAGTYLVGLTVIDSSNQESFTSKSVTVGPSSSGGRTPPDEPPTATFAATPRSPVAGENVTFQAAASSDSDGSIVSYHWDFGDGSPDLSGVTVNHRYKRHGGFTVTLTVTDSSGQTVGRTTGIEVRRPNRIDRVRLRIHRQRRVLEITLGGAGVLGFRLFGSRHSYTVTHAKTVLLKMPRPASLLAARRGARALLLGANLHFTPTSGTGTTVRITLRISPERISLTRVKLPRSP